MPFTDEKRHGYVEQQLPLLAENRNPPPQLWGGECNRGVGGRPVSIKHL